MSVLIDSHCHLDLSAFTDDRGAVIQRAHEAGVGALMVPAVDRAHWAGLLALAGDTGAVSIGVALGLHPCFEHQADDLDALARALGNHPEVMALGECGLDGVAGVLPMVEQIALCQGQLALAHRHRLPVILHVRKAHNEMLSLLSRQPLPAGGVVHGFSGSLVQAQQYWRHGIHLGVGGVITYPRANKTRQALAAIDVEALVLETDSPDMPLCGHQGERNEPARVADVLAQLAQLREQPIDTLKAQLTANTQRLFPRLVN
ncbi:TatD family hydrolase [Ferrimonas balearica]|uniref:TatD family hydrolase n=1 Tax=Ferrimonas balearica TaxID=44012 RepID=UPI002D80A5DD|nr:TatD family hydrolase [Ferrimonas balearica]MBY6017556.1 TatD family hydrolase [Halomonas denitrificans]MBY6093895.1 TatD family hydrolase [Ferrimonas balearica]